MVITWTSEVWGVLTTGVDLVEIVRIERTLERYGDRFLARVFTPNEVLYCHGRVPELAARFAAKEAVSKALGVGMRVLARDGIHWQDVEVIGDRRGKPFVRLSGRAAERAGELELTEWAVSLSHTREHAIAFVVAR
jgi:holo-[acyl-carrier protein] synthase